MAARDIAWYSSKDGSPDPFSYAVTASQSFLEGEAVLVVAAGTLSEAADDPSAITGIAAHRSTDVDGTALPVGRRVTVYRTSPGQVFRTTNFATDGAGTAATPTVANVGDTAGLDFSGGNWFLDTNKNNVICAIVDVLDSKGQSLSDPLLNVGTGSIVLFEFI